MISITCKKCGSVINLKELSEKPEKPVVIDLPHCKCDGTGMLATITESEAFIDLLKDYNTEATERNKADYKLRQVADKINDWNVLCKYKPTLEQVISMIKDIESLLR